MPEQNNQEQFLRELNQFLGEASRSTYAGGMAGTVEGGYTALAYRKGDWNYKDMYTGWFRSWGTETIFYKGRPVWVQNYGGGMEEKHVQDTAFAHETFEFLKKALKSGEKAGQFQPRGQKFFKDGDWEYHSSLNGDISAFTGSEEIRHKGERVFFHDFVGGIVIPKG
jgi:hypothetical protein